MKSKEFKVEVEKLGLKVVRRSGADLVINDGEVKWIFAQINNDEPCKIDTENYYSHMISEETFRQLFHILVKFAQTTIEERRYEEDD